MKRLNKLYFILLQLCLTTTLLGTEVTSRNVEALTGLSTRLFHGRCIAVKEIFQPNAISYTEYTFEILNSVKGLAKEQITFRQFGLIHPVKLPDGTIFLGRITGMPVYEKGKEYLLFLLPDSRLGLTSTAGLFQGSFKIFQNERGEKYAMNPVNNRGLMLGLPAAKKRLLKTSSHAIAPNGAIELRSFLQLIQSFIKK